mmetsp:Transcript_19686/g.46732  ORF Transcript_19686/g.46732 Transcript_19686/m.46732 type:complete len:212 (-) Transcript_19686:2124-2759(-)
MQIGPPPALPEPREPRGARPDLHELLLHGHMLFLLPRRLLQLMLALQPLDLLQPRLLHRDRLPHVGQQAPRLRPQHCIERARVAPHLALHVLDDVLGERAPSHDSLQPRDEPAPAVLVRVVPELHARELQLREEIIIPALALLRLRLRLLHNLLHSRDAVHAKKRRPRCLGGGHRSESASNRAKKLRETRRVHRCLRPHFQEIAHCVFRIR